MTRNATTVLLVRHGETDWNREGRMQGWAPTSLNDRGHEQARRLGDALSTEYDIDRIVASDLTRTRETTAGIREGGVDADPRFESDWRERALGVYQGFTRTDLNEQFPAVALPSGRVALDERPEDGESYADMYERVDAAWERLLAEADGETVLIVTHGGPIVAVLASLNGHNLLSAVESFGVSNCGLTEVDPTGEVRRQDELPFERVEPR